jgi:TonB-linked SusC/RagA family outer membrane protein
MVTNRAGEGLPGADVRVKSLPGGVVSGADGGYVILASPGSTLVFSSLGYAPREVAVGKSSRQTINVTLEEVARELEEVSVVGYGTQRKVSVVGSISTVRPEVLLSGGVSSVSNALSGRVAGLIGVQRGGEPGADVSEFWIRGISTFGAGRDALVLIDGIDRGAASLNDLAPEDVESFSVLKDATATAVYGARGANGVILINTRRGREGVISVSVNVKAMVETLPRLPRYLRAYDYARLANEASIVRGGGAIYSPATFEIIRYNMDPDLFPDVSWQDEILRRYTRGAQGNVNISGGGRLAKYYMSGSYRTNDAIYKESGMERYHSNVRRDQYAFRANVDVDVTPGTRVSLLLATKLVDMNRPGVGTTGAIWAAQANITPLTVPVAYSNGLFPSYGSGVNTSPTVLLNQTGFITERENSTESLLTVEQRVLEGLRLSASISFDNLNFHQTSRTKMPDLFMASDRDWRTGELIVSRTVAARPMQFASASHGRRTIYAEAKLDYNASLGKHRLGALLLYQQKDYQRTDVSDELLSIPERDQGVAGRLTYSYNDLYFIEGNFGYSGSENFPKGQRFGFFPSVAAGWVVSNHAWVRRALPFVNTLKLRYSYGLVGNDEIENTRFPYLSTVNMAASGYLFGDAQQIGQTGISEAAVGSTGLVWERAVKQNWGVDALLWQSLSLSVDAFVDHRDNIFMKRASLPGTVGLGGKTVWGNVGKMRSWGADGTASYTRRLGAFNVELRGNFTFTRDKIIDYDEEPPRYPYQARKGTSNGVTRGLVALGLFKDEADVAASPAQFGKVMPGDIKYQDVNGDDRVDDDDILPIGNSNVPKIQYGFAASVAWRGVDAGVFFRGSGKVDYFMGGAGFYPFAGGRTGNVLSIVKQQRNRWTPASYSGDAATENPDARFPRLTYGENANNNRNSTFWLANGAFLRLKTLEVGYTLPARLARRVAMTRCRLALIGDNLRVWDKVKLWDPEQASSNGAAYPLTRSYSLVIQISF